jgi:sigma-E factor negative regulatory protein RseB
MSQSVDVVNYEGTMVHFLGGDTSVLEVTQRVDGERVTERIRSEDDDRELIRDDGAVTWFFREQRAVPIERPDRPAAGGHALSGRLKRATRVNDTYYNVAFAGSERVAGRDARILVIRPKDSYRYGYRLWLDRSTAMPLKTQLLSSDGGILEQILFTRLVIHDHMPDGAVRPSRAGAGPSPPLAVARRAPPRAWAEWEAARVPPGYALMGHHDRAPSSSTSGLHHLVYSDGLATVSLFVEPAVAAAEQAEGLSQVGASNAYITTVDGYMVTAIGEAPVETVEMLARSARPLVAPDRQ